MNVRPATAADAALLLRWRNDPEARAMSFDTSEVPATRHNAWLAAKLADPRAELWIGALDGEAIGQVRFDLVDSATALVSISVDPSARGKGHGLTLLRAAMARQGLGASVLRAAIRSDNSPSLLVFERAGFAIVAEETDRVVLERRA